MEAFYFLFIIACVVAAIASVVALANAGKNKKSISDRDYSSTPYGVPASGYSARTEPKPAVIKHEARPVSQGPAHNTIYAFNPAYQKRLCYFCDGENQHGAKTCVVCGRDLL